MTNVDVIHCHPHPHIGETLTVNYLRRHLPNGVLLVNYHLPDGTGTQEIDVVALNYNGVYLLEVKHWYGSIEADQVHWCHASGDLRLSPIPIIEQKAKLMHGFLANQGWENISVVGLVVLSKGVAALTHCRANEVYHRNLTPASIYLTSEGHTLVGDFDFSKGPTVSRTLAQTGKPLVVGRHIAPEQAFHASDIDARTDVYSLGAVWYDMLFRPKAGEPLDRGRVAQAPLPEDGQEILQSMLAERRSNRPASMEEVRNWLALLAEELS
jgi:serine/threonine protein kinase